MDIVETQKFIIGLIGNWLATATAKSLQSCPTLCNPIDGSPPSSPVPRILKARTLEWVAISFSNGNWLGKKQIVDFKICATPRAILFLKNQSVFIESIFNFCHRWNLTKSYTVLLKQLTASPSAHQGGGLAAASMSRC